MAVVNSWDINANFWVLHPQLLLAEGFKEFHKQDKSKNKEDSSKIMWAIAFIYDNESQYSNWPIKDRIKFVNTEILEGKIKFSEQEYKAIIKTYDSFQDTPARRQLKEWARIMDEKTDLLKTLKYTTESYKMVEEMLISNSKLYSELERIQAKIDQEEVGTKTKGGSQESLSEKGDLA